MRNYDKSEDKTEQIERGLRIKNIRENELHLNKTDLAKEIGVSSQFLGLVEKGNGNLVYKSLKSLCRLSSHSSDYILFGIDDEYIANTLNLFKKYSEPQIVDGIECLIRFAQFMKSQDTSKE